MPATADDKRPRPLTRARCLREAAMFLLGPACLLVMALLFGVHSASGVALGSLLGYSYALGDRGGWLLLARRVGRGERLVDPDSIPGRPCPAGLFLAQARAVGSLLMATLLALALLAWPLSSSLRVLVWGLYVLATVAPAVGANIALRRYVRRYARQNAVDEALVADDPVVQKAAAPDTWWSREKRDGATLRNRR